MIYNCCCQRDICPDRWKTVQVKFNGVLEEAEPDDFGCETCGEPMKVLGHETTVSYATFASSSPEVKREVLKKRAHKHYLKEIKDKKIEMVRKFDKGMLG